MCEDNMALESVTVLDRHRHSESWNVIQTCSAFQFPKGKFSHTAH